MQRCLLLALVITGIVGAHPAFAGTFDEKPIVETIQGDTAYTVNAGGFQIEEFWVLFVPSLTQDNLMVSDLDSLYIRYGLTGNLDIGT